jgi:phage terminase Nu1 subunit (DNA packaging protein)
VTDLAALELSTAEMASLLELTPRRIQQLAVEGAVVRSRRGFYALGPSLKAYLAWLRGQAEGSPGDEERVARARKLHAEAELAERRVADARGSTVTVEYMRVEFEAAAALVAAEIRNVPARHGADARPEDPGEGELVLERVMDELLRAIARAFDEGGADAAVA